MGKLNIPQELSDKISNSLRIKKSDIVDSGANKPIIREPIKRNQENKERDSPVKINNEPTKRNSPVKRSHESPKRYSPVKRSHESPKRYSPVKRNNEETKQNSPMKNPVFYTKKIFYKTFKKDKFDRSNKLDYIKITKVVFISSIIGGIGITLGIKLGAILFL
jgi:hypothetical protein